MKAITILKYLYNGSELGMPSLGKINEAIEELKDLQSDINASIEEIEYALAKPEYASVYLNNALRFLKEKGIDGINK